MPAILKQHEGSLVSPRDDAVLNLLFNNQYGIIKGCEITHVNTNQIRVEDGYAYICGRLVQIEEETVISPFAGQAGARGELILKLDTLSDTPARLIARTPRQELVQEDINGEGTVYEYLLGTYTITDVKISELATVYELVYSGASRETVDPMLATEPGFAADAKMTKEAIDNCFQSVSDGKTLVASAITGKGISTASDATFKEMAANIKKIVVGAKSQSGTKSYSLSNWGTINLTIPFSSPFGSAPSIQATAVNSRGENDQVTIVSKTASAFVVKIYHGADNQVTGTLTWNASSI